jgi:heat shock protein HspQ
VAEPIEQLTEIMEDDIRRFVAYIIEQQLIYDERVALIEWRQRKAQGLKPHG